MTFCGMASGIANMNLTPITAEDFQAEIAIIGGSGMQDLELLEEPLYSHFSANGYGLTSAPLKLGVIEGRKVLFMPRHGSPHAHYPHQIPYAANLAVLKKVGVKYIVSTSMAGSLRETIAPGDIVIPDQFVNYTHRDDKETFGLPLIHCPMATPYCDHLRARLIKACRADGVENFSETGTVAVIDGPRFNTIGESRKQQADRCDLVNMTQYPEAYYARLLGICYANIAAITDYDVCIDHSLNLNKGNWTRVLNVFQSNIKALKDVLYEFLTDPYDIDCNCADQTLQPFFSN